MDSNETGTGNGGERGPFAGIDVGASAPTTSEGGTVVVGDGTRAMLDTPELRAAIVAGFKRIAELEAERSKINADIKAEREGLCARSLNKQAIKDGERYHKMNEGQRLGYDDGVRVVRKAMELPIQPPLDLGPELPAATGGAGAASEPGAVARGKGKGKGGGATAKAATH